MGVSQPLTADTGREARWGRWPSQVFMLTDEIKEKVGHARQVPGRHLDGDRERQTVPNHT